MPTAELGEQVVRQPRELRRLVGRSNELERRIGEREHLLQAVEFVEQREPRIDVPQGLEARKRGERHMAGNDGAEAIEIRLRHEMIEDVDHHVQPARRQNADVPIVCQALLCQALLCHDARAEQLIELHQPRRQSLLH